MKCFDVQVTGPAKNSVVAGLPVWTKSDRPSVFVGRTYEFGNVFHREEVVRGELIPFTDVLIQSPTSINLNRLIDGRYVDIGSGAMDVSFDEDQDSVLVHICVEGYRELQLQAELESFGLLKSADVTYHGSYVTDRAQAFLFELKRDTKLVFGYGVPKKIKTEVNGDKWWQLSRWFPYTEESWIVEFHDFEVFFDGETVICQEQHRKDCV